MDFEESALSSFSQKSFHFGKSPHQALKLKFTFKQKKESETKRKFS